MAHKTPAQVVTSATKTTTGTSPTIAVGDLGANMSVGINVTAVSGTTPSMVASVEWSHDGGVTFYKADGAGDVFTAITSTGTTVKQFPIKAPHYHVVWTLTGTTPSFTFAVSHFVN